MESRDFCFWLQGFFELSGTTDRITTDQATLIRRHLDLVFAHEGFPVMREGPSKTPISAPSPTNPEPVREAPPEPSREPVQPIEPAHPPVRC